MNARTILTILLTVAVGLGFVCTAAAQEKSDVSTELKAIVDQVNAKLKSGKDSKQDLAENFQQLDALLAKHKDEKSDEVARVAAVKASLSLRVGDTAAGQAELQQLVKEYPGTAPAKGAAQMLAAIQQQQASKKTAATLVPGALFPDFTTKDVQGRPLSVSSYRGKVVLIDFWATWCGPCVGELPNVLKTYQKYHAQGFDIIGVSLDQDKQKLESFIAQKGMAWQQYFDGGGWDNKLAVRFGIESIPATYLLDRQGRIIGSDLRGDDLAEAVSAALAKK